MTEAITYEWALRRIELLESVIAQANPLGWVASQDLDGAQAWERMAAAALSQRETLDLEYGIRVEPPTELETRIAKELAQPEGGHR